MRKILISIILAILIIVSALFMVKGVTIIGCTIPGFITLKNKNSEIDDKISNLSNLVGVTYSNTNSNLQKTAKTLLETKTEYENQAILSNTNVTVSQTDKYDIDYLWLKVGDYARKENTTIKMELTSNETDSSKYNLNFTVTGGYVNITDFIYDIENDSKLGFKVEEFKMSENGSLTATFVCKEISVIVGTIESNQTENTNTKDAQNTGNNTSSASGTSGTEQSSTSNTGLISTQ